MLSCHTLGRFSSANTLPAPPPMIISNTCNFYPYQHTQPTPPFHAKLTKVGSLPQCLVLMCVGGVRSPLTTGVLRGSSWDLTYCKASVPQPTVGGKRNSCSVHLENTPPAPAELQPPIPQSANEQLPPATSPQKQEDSVLFITTPTILSPPSPRQA